MRALSARLGRLFGLSVGFFLLLPAIGLGAPEKTNDQVFLASLPHFEIGATERVVGFSCSIRSARVVSVTEVPNMWSVTIENGSSDIATISAQILVGAAAFTASTLDYFTNFMTLEKTTGDPHAPPFDFTVELNVVVWGKDSETYRKIKFTRDKIILTPKRS